ncbi:MAG: substrate-binding domain-containing protein, partial [Pseudomonadota bacterium]
MTLPRRALLACLAALALPGVAAAEGFVVLGSTTTTENSGLLAHLAPLFEAETGIALRVVVAGTGKILRLAENGDVDVALTHDPVGE